MSHLLHCLPSDVGQAAKASSIFNNEATGWDEQAPVARSMILVLDMKTMSVSLEKDYPPFLTEPSTSQGSTRVQANGDVLAG